MSFAFWNNPLIVSAFRVKYRRGGISGVLLFHAVVLAAVGMGLHYYDRAVLFLPHLPWAVKFLAVVLWGQVAVSSFWAITATARSIQSEVTNRTLDFQRIAALGPRQILLGKLLGEPAQAYLLIVATVPFTAVCMFYGAVTPGVLALLYVQMFTTTLLWGGLGLIHRLEAPAGKPGQTGGGRVGIGLGVMALMLFPQMLSLGDIVFTHPWSGAVAGLLTPLPALFGQSQGDAWRFGLAFWGMQLPFLLVTPVSQLLLTWLCFEVMTRRLTHPMNPPFSKPVAYALLAVVDLLAAGVLYDSSRIGFSLPQSAGAFCLVHILFSLWLAVCITPGREMLRSWAWRFRGRQSWLGGLLTGERTHNGLALLLCCALGVFGLLGLVVLPGWVAGGVIQRDDIRTAAPALTTMLAGMCLLILTPGVLMQAAEAVIARSKGWALGVLFTYSLALHLIGRMRQIPFLLDLSPTVHVEAWFRKEEPMPSLTGLASGGVVLIGLAWWWLFRWLRRTTEEVDRQLQAMGAR